jgi:hypothetical protein
MEQAPDQARQPGQQHRLVGDSCAGNARDEAEIRHQSVVSAEHRRAQVVARGGAAVPGLGARDVGPGRDRPARATRGHGLDHGGVSALLGRDRLRIALSGILVAIGKFRRGDGRQHEARAKTLRQLGQQARAQCRREALVPNARRGQLVAP